MVNFFKKPRFLMACLLAITFIIIAISAAMSLGFSWVTGVVILSFITMFGSYLKIIQTQDNQQLDEDRP